MAGEYVIVTATNRVTATGQWRSVISMATGRTTAEVYAPGMIIAGSSRNAGTVGLNDGTLNISSYKQGVPLKPNEVIQFTGAPLGGAALRQMAIGTGKMYFNSAATGRRIVVMYPQIQ